VNTDVNLLTLDQTTSEKLKPKKFFILKYEKFEIVKVKIHEYKENLYSMC